MANLTKQFDTYKLTKEGKRELHVMIVGAKANSREEASELGYEDFDVDLFIENRYVGEISSLLSKAGVLEALIDGIDWEKEYCDQVSEYKVEEEFELVNVDPEYNFFENAFKL